MNLLRIAKELEEVLAEAPTGRVADVRVTRATDNPQTNMDKSIDAYLAEALPAILDVPIMSEEDPGRVLGRSGLCWIVDPIDGTINVIAGAGDFAICVSLVNAATLQSLIGMVYLPRLTQLFKAVAGEGAYQNGDLLDKRAIVGESPPAVQRIAAFGVPKDGQAVARRMSDALHNLFATGWVTRQQGAASVDICRVATGSWAAFFEYGLMYWDFAAAALVASEAGCSVYAVPCETGPADIVPIEFDLVVARTPELLAEVMTAVNLRPQDGMREGR
ncbi:MULTISPECIES: inositol monophosphatase family protein [unclassified Nonomuraea]|uniref:inositol monophosphatase family protein n=1 Tax=unclassified Nonomuraea TaxID=2593643 RepID=UPI0035BF4F13